jgi:hypothetical protein
MSDVRSYLYFPEIGYDFVRMCSILIVTAPRIEKQLQQNIQESNTNLSISHVVVSGGLRDMIA